RYRRVGEGTGERQPAEAAAHDDDPRLCLRRLWHEAPRGARSWGMWRGEATPWYGLRRMTDSTPPNESADRPSSSSKEPGASEAEPNDAERKPAKKVEERTSSAHRSVRLGDRTLAYTATAGTLVLLDEDDEARAS